MPTEWHIEFEFLSPHISLVNTGQGWRCHTISKLTSLPHYTKHEMTKEPIKDLASIGQYP